MRGTRERVRVTDGAIATSGLDRRVWRRPDGSYAHHLLDPSTGEPAWTGLIAATALAPTALEAEALAKAALLSGAQRARRVLAAGGGILVHDSGEVERIGLVPPVRVAGEVERIGLVPRVRVAGEVERTGLVPRVRVPPADRAARAAPRVVAA